MTVDDSTPDATSVASTVTEITPPSLNADLTSPGSDLRPKDQLVDSLRSEIRTLRVRVDVLEAERRRFIQPTGVGSTTESSTEALSTTAAPAANTLNTTPMWRTKTGKQAGWQPARR